MAFPPDVGIGFSCLEMGTNLHYSGCLGFCGTVLPLSASIFCPLLHPMWMECTIIKNSERLLFNELVEFNEKETDRGTDKTNSARIDFMSCSLISCA